MLIEKLLNRLSKISAWQAAVILVIFGLLIFSVGLKNPFLNDDQSQIVDNVVIHSIRNLPLFFRGSTFYGGNPHAPLNGIYYRPLMVTSFSILYSIFGPHSFYFHIFQLVLVIGSAIILYLIFNRLVGTLLALLLAIIFLIHPINSQDAFYIPNLQDALFMFFGLLAFWILIRFKSAKSLLLVAACLFLSLLSKEAGMLFILLSGVYMWWFDRKRLWLLAGTIAPPIALYLFLKIRAVGLAGHSNLAPVDRLGLFGRLLNAPSVLLFYVSKFIFPLKLSSGYYWAYTNFSLRHVVLPLVIDMLIASVIVYFAFHIRKRVSAELHASFVFFALWSAIGLAFYLQILPLDMTASETWFYFPMVGVLGMIGVLLVAYQSHIRPEWFFISASLVICLLGIRTIARGTEWSSVQSLATHDIAASKEDYVAYFLLTQQLDKQGSYKLAADYAQRSIDIFPTYTNCNELGRALGKLRDYSGAYKAYHEGIRYGSNINQIYENLAQLALVYRSYPQNAPFIIDAVNKFPSDSMLWMYAAIIDQRLDNNTDAKQLITRAAQLGPVPAFIQNAISANQHVRLDLDSLSTSIIM